MKRQQLLLLLVLSAWGPATQAGLFSDDEARLSIQQLGKRLADVEMQLPQATSKIEKLGEANERQIKTSMDFQSKLDELRNELRSLRGQLEEVSYKLQDAEKRQKDFYVDLDSRLRLFEEAEEKRQQQNDEAKADPQNPLTENRLYEQGYAQVKAAKHAEAVVTFQTLLNNHPDSVHVVNAYFWLAEAYFAQGDYQNALRNYGAVLKIDASHFREPEILLNMGICLKEVGDAKEAKKTLQRLVKKYPKHSTSERANTLLKTL